MKKISSAVLLQNARGAMAKAYAPYSKFRVGAALQASDGGIFTGCNVENASYGLTICAERAAVAAAVSAGKRKFTAVAICSSGNAASYPCGACRQVLAEFCSPSTPVFIVKPGKRAGFIKTSHGHLLPDSFTLRRK